MGLLPLQSEVWFDYPITVQPHHTDYAGVVWHGSYLAWMEEARVAALKQVGVEFADLVAIGCDLPVIDLQLNYRKAVQMGQQVRVRSCLKAVERVRLIWIQNVCALETELCYVAGRVVNVPVDRQQQKIVRAFPPLLEKAIAGLTRSTEAF
ncbi:acyl-CoA thioesterase [Altericista sp. CCNU0014]|uniref:acyl-CoA thioesterase n=1 Tax=Altericista sp. CCNU0014 TaxID=3082949 RepID=UPI00384AC9E4